MNSASAALLWHCWHKTRLYISLQLLSAIVFIAIMLVFLASDEKVQTQANLAVFISAASVWILGFLLASGLEKNKGSNKLLGFPLRTELQFPVATAHLVAATIGYCVVALYLCFMLPVLVTAIVLDLALPPAMIHFMVIQYACIFFSVVWFSSHGLLMAVGWMVVIAAFYLNILWPEFSFDAETEEFMGGPWSSAIVPAGLAVLSLIVLFLGVHGQRSGENLFLSSGHKWINIGSMSATVFRFIKQRCPTSSATAAQLWRERCSRGFQFSVSVGVGIGLLVLVILKLTSLRGLWDGPLEYSDVTGFAEVAYFSVVVGILATLFGVQYKNGAAVFSTFDRTLPISTVRLVTIRVGIALSSVLLVAISELLTLAIAGPLFLEGFGEFTQTFLWQFTNIFTQGVGYTLVQFILALCFIYYAIIFWGAFVSWFSVRSKLMSYLFVGVSLYPAVWIITLTAVGFGGPDFAAVTSAVRNLHAWVLIAFIPLVTTYLFGLLVHEGVISAKRIGGLCLAGLVLAMLQILDVGWSMGDESDSDLVVIVFFYAIGLLPLTATAIALWTQHRLRHN